ncbi:hypothetical protein VTP01DRAFT_5937 [Rhizomucor pusillus]|uniref:uncharacterized protein n=1 Tax=Rhizomucor pusillus TaxID=4840 RepID=UPI0037421AD6
MAPWRIRCREPRRERRSAPRVRPNPPRRLRPLCRLSSVFRPASSSFSAIFPNPTLLPLMRIGRRRPPPRVQGSRKKVCDKSKSQNRHCALRCLAILNSTSMREQRKAMSALQSLTLLVFHKLLSYQEFAHSIS